MSILHDTPADPIEAADYAKDHIVKALEVLSATGAHKVAIAHNETNGTITPDVGSLILGSNVIIGLGAAGVDYSLTFSGSPFTGIITWKEDEDYFQFADAVYVNNTAGFGTPPVATSRVIVSASGTTQTVGINGQIVYSGTQQYAFGAQVQAELISTHSHAAPVAVGGRFSARAYSYVNPSSVASVIGGQFLAYDRSGQTYTRTGSGSWKYYGGYFYVVAAAGDWTANPPVVTYGAYLDVPPTGYGTNHTHWQLYSASGNCYFGIGSKIGVGVVPTAELHLGAGSADAGTAPIKLTSGPLLTTPEPGTIEFYDGKYYITPISEQRVIDRTGPSVIVATVTVTNTVAETTVYTSLLPANAVKAGQIIKGHTSGDITNKDAASDITIRLKMGAATIHTFDVPIGNVTNAPWHLDCKITIRTTGAAGTLAFHGDIAINGTEVGISFVGSVNTTTANNLTVTAQWDNADAGNIFNCFQGFTEYKN